MIQWYRQFGLLFRQLLLDFRQYNAAILLVDVAIELEMGFIAEKDLLESSLWICLCSCIQLATAIPILDVE